MRNHCVNRGALVLTLTTFVGRGLKNKARKLYENHQGQPCI